MTGGIESSVPTITLPTDTSPWRLFLCISASSGTLQSFTLTETQQAIN